MARTEGSDADEQNDSTVGSGDCELLPEHDLNDPPTNCLLTPPIVSDHSIGSGRSRSRHRRRHRRRRSPLHSKRRESNYLAAVCSMIVIVLLCTALADPQWFYLRGGGCKDIRGNIVDYLGVSQFFYLGHFVNDSKQTEEQRTVYKFGPRPTDVLVSCVTGRIVSIMKSIISLCLFGITLSLGALLLDLLGPTHKVLKVMRRHGILNILTVSFCVVINGFCYWATDNLSSLQQMTKVKTSSKVDVQFSVSFYLITAAGTMSVIAAACNLLRRHPAALTPPRPRTCDQDLESLLSEIEGMDFAIDMIPSAGPHLPSPPPYSP